VFLSVRPGAPELYYSIAFSQPSDAVVPARTTNCDVNNYRFSITQCDSPLTSITTHDALVVCNPITGVPKLDYCPVQRYICLIVAGPSPVTEDAFIEWYYQIPYGVVAGIFHLTGKMTFSASAAYIKHWSNDGANYVGGPSNFGVPMFVQPSHNQI
jgi:hypothetical protein